MTTNIETDHDKTNDPHGLLVSGEPLATLPELARMIGCSGKALHGLLGGPLCHRVRYVHRTPGPCLYPVADVLAAVEPHRGQIEERRLRAAEHEAAEHAAKVARTTGRQEADAALQARRVAKRTGVPKGTATKPAPTPEQQQVPPSTPTTGPEVFFRRGTAPSRVP